MTRDDQARRVPTKSVTLLAAILACFGLAALAPVLVQRWRRGAAWVLALLPAGLTLFLASQLPGAATDPTHLSLPWIPQLNLTLSLRADALSLLFALLISGVGTLVVIYAGAYLADHRDLGRFFGWLLFFMGAMLGVALADNLLVLYIFWELTSISSFFLIGFDHENETARAAARQALVVTTGGGLAMLAGFLLLGQAAGTLELTALLSQGPAVRASPQYLPALALILLGAFTKSAQFPFHFWLPEAMQAPTPVSAYLHSATMVKAGVYLLARLSPLLAGTPAWTWAVGGVGLVTLLVGGLLALGQTDLKRLLAYSTIAALGLMVGLLGLGGAEAVTAAVVFLLGHALYKGALFLVAGVLDHETGSRDVRQLSGLWRALPAVAVSAFLAALSFAGVPPLVGFIGKELAYETALHVSPWVTAAVVAGGSLFVFAAVSAGVGPFWGRQAIVPHVPTHRPPLGLWLGPAVLGGLGLVLGVAPGVAAGPLLSPAVAAATGQPAHVALALWHGLTPALGLSGLSLAVGAGLYLLREPVRRVFARAAWPWGPAWAFQSAAAILLRLARGQTRLLQSGYLRHYLLIIFVTTTGLTTLTLAWFGGFQWPGIQLDVRFYEVALIGLIAVGTLIAITSRSRLGAVAGLGLAGYGVSLIFLVFGAPDLAMTQFLVESLTVILFVLVLYHLPGFTQLSSRRARLRDALVALLSGGLMTALVLSVAGLNWYPSISGYFAENALALGHGRNVVNVLLVDFRGFDTLGEITVLSIAALGVYALLKLGQEPDK